MKGRLLLPLLLLSLFAATSSAADTLVITKSGYYLLTTDATGSPTLQKFMSVVKLDEPSPPEPPTNPTELEAHRKAVQAATDKVSDPNKANTKKALAELYRTIAGLPVTEPSQLQTATTLMFNALGLPMWSEWKTTVDKSLSGFASLDDAKRAWLIVAEVLEGAAKTEKQAPVSRAELPLNDFMPLTSFRFVHP